MITFLFMVKYLKKKILEKQNTEYFLRINELQNEFLFLLIGFGKTVLNKMEILYSMVCQLTSFTITDCLH